MTDFTERRSSPPEPHGWHLKKEVNVSIIISLVGVAIACVTAYNDLKKDIELIKADTAELHQRDNQINTDMRDALRTMQEQFQRMDAKLDRLIERGQK